jgi:hypothetical protein
VCERTFVYFTELSEKRMYATPSNRQGMSAGSMSGAAKFRRT